MEMRNPGEPIPPDVLPQLTQPFFTTKATGTGLGLSIVAKLVEAHGGDIQIESDGERGTRIVLILPGNGAGESRT
jgi:signal transduction histidine kinase